MSILTDPGLRQAHQEGEVELPGTELPFRPMTPDDLDDVVRVECEVYSHPWTRGNFSDALAAGYPAWVMRQGQDLLAYYLVMAVPDELHILNLSVAPAHQGKGLARALLRHVDEQAAQRRCDSVLLEVRVSNQRARDLYDKAGFQQIGLRRGYYPSVRGREDAIVMRKLVGVEAGEGS